MLVSLRLRSLRTEPQHISPIEHIVRTLVAQTEVLMLRDKDRYLSILLISPSILAVLIFIYGFIAWSVRVSLSQWKGLNPDYTWNGLKNYIDLFADPRFAVDIRNTVLFTVVFVAGSLILGFLLAVMLDQGLRGEGFFRSLFLFPMAISYIVTGVVWRWLMNPAMGS